MAGAVIGILFGGTGSLVGAFVGPLVVIKLPERTASRPWLGAWRAGLGATIGVLAGAIGKVVACLLIMCILTVDVVLRSWN